MAECDDSWEQYSLDEEIIVQIVQMIRRWESTGMSERVVSTNFIHTVAERPHSSETNKIFILDAALTFASPQRRQR